MNSMVLSGLAFSESVSWLRSHTSITGEGGLVWLWSGMFSLIFELGAEVSIGVLSRVIVWVKGFRTGVGWDV